MYAIALWAMFVAGAADIRDGTVIVLENSNRVVEAYTKSDVTHVGMVLNADNQPYVYEATPKEVRRITLANYYRELGDFNRGRRETHKLRVRLYQPMVAYSEKEIALLKSYLESQVGRRYSVKGYVRHKPGDGIHCAELVSTALARSGRYTFDQVYSVSPHILVAQIIPFHDPPLDVALPTSEPVGSWCERSWNWWGGFFAWCGWAWWEARSFYR